MLANYGDIKHTSLLLQKLFRHPDEPLHETQLVQEGRVPIDFVRIGFVTCQCVQYLVKLLVLKDITEGSFIKITGNFVTCT